MVPSLAVPFDLSETLSEHATANEAGYVVRCPLGQLLPGETPEGGVQQGALELTVVGPTEREAEECGQHTDQAPPACRVPRQQTKNVAREGISPCQRPVEIEDHEPRRWLTWWIRIDHARRRRDALLAAARCGASR